MLSAQTGLEISGNSDSLFDPVLNVCHAVDSPIQHSQPAAAGGNQLMGPLPQESEAAESSWNDPTGETIELQTTTLETDATEPTLTVSSATTPGAISGILWDDVDRDGVIDSGEAVRQRQRVFIDVSQDGVWQDGEPTSYTGPEGNFQFSSVEPGTHRLGTETPAGWEIVFPETPVTVTVSDGATTVQNIGLAPRPSAVEGRIWHDLNADGSQQNGEPGIAGLRVYLDTNKNGLFDAGEPSSLTQSDATSTTGIDESGRYRIDGIVADRYLVRYELPSDAEQSYPAIPQLGMDESYRIDFDYVGFRHHPWDDLRVSETGQYVVFSTTRPLDPADTNQRRDIYWVDRLSGDFELISVNAFGEPGNGNHFEPDVSGDGRFVTFRSGSTDLDPNDDSSLHDIFVRDRQLGTTSLVSVDLAGGDAGANTLEALISPDGQRVLFHSRSQNLVINDTNGYSDTFIRYLDTGVTERISLTENGNQIFGGHSWGGDMSADGRYIIFESISAQVGGDDTNDAGMQDIFWRDLQTGDFQIASLSDDGRSGNGKSSKRSLSDDGRWVAFDSNAADLTADPHPGPGEEFNVFLKDMLTGDLQRLSLPEPSAPDFPGHSRRPEISGDGRWVAFETIASLVAEDVNQLSDIYLYDRLNDKLRLVSYSETAGVGNGPSNNPVISADGTTLAFTTEASNLTGTPRSIVMVDLLETGDAVDVPADQTVTSVDFGLRDQASPEVTSITGVGNGIDSAEQIAFDVTFSEAVTGVDASDFSIDATGLSGASVLSVVGADTSYRVTIATGTGEGTLRLDLLDDDSIVDVQGTPVGGVGTGDGDFVGELFEIERTSPVVESVLRLDSEITNADAVRFQVNFSESVSGVDAGDFQLDAEGLTGNISLVTGGPSSFVVRVLIGSGDGTAGLNVLANGSIADAAGNTLNSTFTSSEKYTIDRTAPAVTAITRLDGSPTVSSSVRYEVAFSEPVIGVDLNDFQVNAQGPSGAVIESIAGSGALYTVTVDTGDGDGTLQLDVVDDDTILDRAGNSLVGAFDGGESYIIDRLAPAVVAILKLDPDPTADDYVNYQVEFSEPVTGVGLSDFQLVDSGLVNAAITSASGYDPENDTLRQLDGFSTFYRVSVFTGSGAGEARVDVIDDDTIIDRAGIPLGGEGFSNGDFAGPAYTIVEAAGIYGTKWADTDRDGLRDPDEPALAGVTIYLDLNQNGQLDSGEPTRVTATDDPNTVDFDETGRYSFTDLAPGDYTVSEKITSLYEQTYPAISGGTGTLRFNQAVYDGAESVDGLASARSVAISPDGVHVYAAGYNDDAVSVFRRDTVLGTLTFIETLKQADGLKLDGATSVSVTPDGSQVLVAAYNDSAFTVFDRDTGTGRLTVRRTFQENVDGINSLYLASSASISPDSNYAYVAGRGDSALTVFQRDAVTGDWSLMEKHVNGVGGVDGLYGAITTTVSPDGTHVYVASLNDNAVAIFRRDANTSGLTYQGFVADGYSGVDGLRGARGLDVSADGRWLFVTGYYEDSLVVFARDPETDSLGFVQHLSSADGFQGLDASYSVISSGDGQHVYVAGSLDDSIGWFEQDQVTGVLSYLGAIADSDPGVEGLDWPYAMALSPDDQDLYAATGNNALVALERDGGVASRSHRVTFTENEIFTGTDFGNYRLPLEVVRTEPQVGGLISAVPAVYEVSFNFEYDVDSVQASDLLIDGSPAAGVTFVDANTVAFDLPPLGEGRHEVSMAGGSIEQQIPGPALVAYSAEFEIDLTPPSITVDPVSTTDTTPALSGTVDDPTAIVSLTIDGFDYQATNHGDGRWSLADDVLVPLPYGVLDLEARATDPAGNVTLDPTVEDVEILRSLVWVTGGGPVVESELYTIGLEHHESVGSIVSWTIDWGDGTIETLSGDPSTASHQYLDGTLGYPIRVTATETSGTTHRNDLVVGPDPRFGAGGFVDVPWGAYSGTSSLDVVEQDDGKIVAIGEGSGNRWMIARYLPDGGADNTFGVDGIVTLDFDSIADTRSRPRAVAVQSDGKIVVAGNAAFNTWAVARLQPDGSLDSSFASDGLITVERTDATQINALALDLEGRIVLGGSDRSNGDDRGLLVRILEDGSFDESFGQDGLVTFVSRYDDDSGFQQLIVDREGRMVAGGFVDALDRRILVARFLADGSLDYSFSRSLGSLSIEAEGLAIDGEGRAYVAGQYGYSMTNRNWVVIRLNEFGKEDWSYGWYGRAEIDMSGANDFVDGITIQRDGRAVVMGHVAGDRFDLALARLNDDGSLDTTFDGDGKWQAAPRPELNERIHGFTLTANDTLLAAIGYMDEVALARYELNTGFVAMVHDQAPSLVANGASSVEEGLEYAIELNVNDPGTDTIQYWTIDWGDGHQELVNGTQSTAGHVYHEGGRSYTPVVTATNEDGIFEATAPTVSVLAVAAGQISGTKWGDVDADGVWDVGETGLGGVTVFVDLNDNGLLDSGEPRTLTLFDDPNTSEDESGRYQLDNVAQGTHVVAAVVPDGRQQSFPGPRALPLERVSMNQWGDEAFGDSDAPQLSDDGRYVVFRSAAGNLVAGDSNGQMDLFVHDRELGTIERASLADDGQQSNREVLAWALSGDGRTVAYEDWRYLSTGALTVRNLDTGQHAWNVSGSHTWPSLSTDGRYIAYSVDSSTTTYDDVYWRDMTSPFVGQPVASGNRQSSQVSISDDGQFVAFTTHASDIVADDTNQRGDVILHSRADNTHTRVSVSSSGVQGNGDSYQADISEHGRFVAFTSDADNLVPGDTNGTADIFVRDMVAGTTERVSVASDGLQADDLSLGSSISADGRFVVFTSWASNLVAGDDNGFRDVFVHDRLLKTTERISETRDGFGANSESKIYSTQRAISADGRYVGFASDATNLVPGDSNDFIDSFVTSTRMGRRLGTHEVPVSSGQVTSDIDFGSVDVAAPEVVNVTIEDGSGTRSTVREMTVTFNELVEIDADAFRVVNLDNPALDVVVEAVVVRNGALTEAVLTFSGTSVDSSGSLLDGNYSLTVMSDHVRDAVGQALDGDGDGVAGGDAVDEFYRRFGDQDGDSDVDGTDLFNFLAAYNADGASSDYDHSMDYDRDGDVDGTDLFQFLQRYNS